MATYLARDALRLPATSLLANSGLCVNIEIKIWLLLGVNVATANNLIFHNISKINKQHHQPEPETTERLLKFHDFLSLSVKTSQFLDATTTSRPMFFNIG